MQETTEMSEAKSRSSLAFADNPDRFILKMFPNSSKTQVFIDGNKRAAIIYANHYLIAHGQGFLVIPEAHVSEFKKLLVAYYEGGDPERITDFLKLNCWKTFNKDVL